MSENLRLYDVLVGSHKTQMRLNADDAEAMGPAAVPCDGVTVPVVVVEVPVPVEAKSRLVTSNKMRGTDDPRPHATTHNREGVR